jgi:hypothetical protein
VNKAHVRVVGDLENFDYTPEQHRTLTRGNGVDPFMVSAAAGFAEWGMGSSTGGGVTSPTSATSQTGTRS